MVSSSADGDPAGRLHPSDGVVIGFSTRAAEILPGPGRRAYPHRRGGTARGPGGLGRRWPPRRGHAGGRVGRPVAVHFGVVILPDARWAEAGERWRRADDLAFDT